MFFALHHVLLVAFNVHVQCTQQINLYDEAESHLSTIGAAPYNPPSKAATLSSSSLACLVRLLRSSSSAT